MFLSEIIVNIISTVVLPVAVMLVVICMVGNMSEEIKLNNFAALFKSINKWVLGISLTAFTVFLTVQGITSATYDGLSFKAAKYAISNSVPIIGGFLSGQRPHQKRARLMQFAAARVRDFGTVRAVGRFQSLSETDRRSHGTRRRRQDQRLSDLALRHGQLFYRGHSGGRVHVLHYAAAIDLFVQHTLLRKQS